MLEIEKPRIETLELSSDGKYGKFVMEPLERGYATTLGNSMRRVLLSTLPGVAITNVKIDGVVHEFSTIPGVKEDVTEIVLNLKGVIAKLHSDTAKKIYIEAAGPGVVTAADIKADFEVEILNPDMYIATLDEGAKLNMEMTLDKGRGYVSAEQNKSAQNIIGVIPIDSIYTPVLKANFNVDNTRVGNVVDKNKLTLEVWTDGSIAARRRERRRQHYGGEERQREGKSTRSYYRRARPFGTQLQLPQARRHQHGRRPYEQVRRGYDEGQKSRPQIS